MWRGAGSWECPCGGHGSHPEEPGLAWEKGTGAELRPGLGGPAVGSPHNSASSRAWPEGGRRSSERWQFEGLAVARATWAKVTGVACSAEAVRTAN